MDTGDTVHRKYFSFENHVNNLSMKDLDISEADTPKEKELKTFIKKKYLSPKEQQEKNSNTQNPDDIDEEINQLKSLLMDFIESGEIDKDIILEAVSHGVTEMFDFMHHEPDHHASFSEKEKEELHNMMMDTIQNTGSDESLALCESLFPQMVNNLEHMMAKIRTPRF